MPNPPEKPPYSVPTMAEIRAMPRNGFKVATTFAGGGGSSTGYRMAGFEIVYANEFVPAAQETYRANMSPTTILDGSDIRTLTAEDILAQIGMGPGDLDILDGSPPCASFSTAGKRNAKWGKVSNYSDTAQQTDDLFFEFARILKGIQPKVFVAENVSGLVRGVSKGYFKGILAALTACGYRVTARLLDAQWLGVPQARQRIIFVGVRNDLPAAPVHPDPLPYRYSIRDALPHIQWQGAGGEFPKAGFRSADVPSGTFGASISSGSGHSPPGWVVADRSGIVLKDFGHPVPQEIRTDAPAPTIMAGGMGGVGTHQVLLYSPGGNGMTDPETGCSLELAGRQTADKWLAVLRKEGIDVDRYECRRLTLGELRALSGFPPDYILTGTYGQRWERIGRSVPPLMMRAVASTIRDKVLDPCAG